MIFSMSSRRLVMVSAAMLWAVQFLTPFGFAAAGKRNPASKFFVAEVEGRSQVTTGEKIEDLTRKSVYSAEGTIVETKPSATSAIVYSNGSGVFFDHDTSVQVRRFVQGPFRPNHADMETEPSISQCEFYLSRGVIAISTSKPSAGSSMTYVTPLAIAIIRGQKLVIETDDKLTKISLLAGDVTVRGGEHDLGGRTLKPGQQAFVTPGNDGGPNIITILTIPAGDLARLENLLAFATMAKNTVYFEVAEPKFGNNPAGITAFDGSPIGPEIVAVPVVPANLPVQFTVSPATLGNR
jgi:hypothetical protein